MNRAQERREIAQDIAAMRAARTWSAVEAIREGMQGLGRWTQEAQRAYAECAANHTNGGGRDA